MNRLDKHIEKHFARVYNNVYYLYTQTIEQLKGLHGVQQQYDTFMKHKRKLNEIVDDYELEELHLQELSKGYYLTDFDIDIMHKYFKYNDVYVNKAYITFVKHNYDTIKDLHDAFDKLDTTEYAQKVKHDKEKIIAVILDMSTKIKTKPLGKDKFVSTIKPMIRAYVNSMNDDDMYNMYKRNRPTKADKKKVVKTDENTPIATRIPWKSARKVSAYAIRHNKDETELEIQAENERVPRFNKRKSKSMYISIVAPRHTYMIDYIFFGRITYLLCVNVNTRKAYCVPTNYDIVNGKMKAYKDNRTTELTIEAMETIIKQTTVKHIICDQEPAFMSKKFNKWLEEHGISIRTYVINTEKTENVDKKMKTHTSLAILDRLVRTIRDMHYNITKIDNPEILPDTMSYLVDEYNNSPHSTLSQIAKRPVSPNEVDNNAMLENDIAYKIIRKNILTTHTDDYNLPVNSSVLVKSDVLPMEKKRGEWLANTYRVDGKNNGLYRVVNANGNTLLVPRWTLRPWVRI